MWLTQLLPRAWPMVPGTETSDPLLWGPGSQAEAGATVAPLPRLEAGSGLSWWGATSCEHITSATEGLALPGPWCPGEAALVSLLGSTLACFWEVSGFDCPILASPCAGRSRG